jgi:hypothetical protein
MKQKKVFESAEIEIVELDRDLLLNSAGTLGEGDWDSFDFGSL